MICRKCKKEMPDAPYCGECGIKQAQERKPLKRPNGTGSVYMLKGRRKRPWAAAVVKGHDKETGEPNRIVLGYYEKRTDAVMALSPHVIESATTMYNYTMHQVYENWKKRPSYEKLSKSMKYCYTAAWKGYEDLHDKKIRLLRAMHYQECVDAAMDEDKSTSYLHKMKSLASKLSEWCMENDIIDKNYARFIDIASEIKVDRPIFSDEQISIFIQHQADREAKIILALIFTGMRPGELCKVRKDESLHLAEGYLINGSKTNAGRNRIIPIIDVARPIFTEYALAASPGEPLFKSPSGDAAISLHNFRFREFYPYLERLGIMKNPYDKNNKRISDEPILFRPYTCRHTFASLSNRVGVDKAVIQKAIGHVVGSNITDDVYIHQQTSEYKAEFSKLDLLATVLATPKK